MIAAPDVLHGRRFGNLVLVGSADAPPWDGLARRTAADPFPARVLVGPDLARFADARAHHDGDTTPSPMPPPGFFGRPTNEAQERP